jgi:peptidoglycan/LPS O-acetylase OafA/YrhL
MVIEETILPTASGLVATDSAGAVVHWLVYFGLYYAVGALLFLYRDQVPLSFGAAAAALLIWLLSYDTAALVIVSQLTLPYIVIVLGYRGPQAVDRFFRRIGDLSYGTYIYAFPVQQLLIHYDTGISPGRLIAYSIPITYACAYLSWHLVERPALRLRRRLTGEPDHAPRAAVVPAAP